MNRILRYLLVLVLMPSLALAQSTGEKKDTKDGEKLIPISREQAEKLVTAIVTAQLENEEGAAALNRKILDVKMDALKRQMLDNALRNAYNNETNQRLAKLENLLLLSLMGEGKIDPLLLQSYLNGQKPGQTILMPNSGSNVPAQQLAPHGHTAGESNTECPHKDKRDCVSSLQKTGKDGKTETETIYLTNETIDSFHYQAFFDFDSYKLSSESKAALDKVVLLMQENKTLNVRLQGYASPEGNLKYNNRLSARRVNACADYIVNRGIEKSRLEIKPAGIDSIKDTYPEARRVDIRPIICE